MKKLLYLTLAVFLYSCEDPSQKKDAFLDGEGIPVPTHSYVNDFTGKMLDTNQVAVLNHKLKMYEDSTTTQIVVICLPTIPENTNGNKWATADLGNETFRKWKIGQKEKNNGVLLTIFFEDHKDNITTGYGVEGALPDITCSQILSEDVKPLFRQEKYYEGIDKAITSMQSALAGEYKSSSASNSTADGTKEDKDDSWTWLLIGIGVCSLIGAANIPFGTILGAVYGGLYYYYFQGNNVPDAFIALIICGIVTLLISLILRLIFTGSIDGDGDSGLFSYVGSDSGGGSSGGDSFSGGGGDSGGGGSDGSW